MYEDSHECTKCSNPASVHFGCVYMTTQVWQGIKLCPVSWVLVCPSPSVLDPTLPCFLSLVWGGGVPHQQQSSTSQWHLLSGKRINCLNAESLAWPHHSMATWVPADMASFSTFAPNVYFLPDWGGGSQDLRLEAVELLTLPHHGERCYEVVGLPWWSNGYHSLLPLQGARFLSLVRELRSHML